MRYYGLKRKRHKEDILYTYAKWYAGIHRILPGKRRRFWQALYKYEYKNKHTFRGNNNCLPSDCFLALDTIIIADLIHREDIPKLQKGIRVW